MCLGVDVSMLLHRICADKLIAMCITIEPSYRPVGFIIRKFESYHFKFVMDGIKPYYVFDCQPGGLTTSSRLY
jgi:hypothetical protein